MMTLLQQPAFVASFCSGSRSCTWFNMAMFLGTNRRSERGTQTVWAFGPEPSIAQQNHMKCLLKKQFNNTIFLVKLNSQQQYYWNALVFFNGFDLLWSFLQARALVICGFISYLIIWFLVILRMTWVVVFNFTEFRGSRKVWGFGCLTRRKRTFPRHKSGTRLSSYLGWERKTWQK